MVRAVVALVTVEIADGAATKMVLVPCRCRGRRGVSVTGSVPVRAVVILLMVEIADGAATKMVLVPCRCRGRRGVSVTGSVPVRAVVRDGMRGMWHGMPECFRRTGRNGKEARRMQKEGIDNKQLMNHN